MRIRAGMGLGSWDTTPMILNDSFVTPDIIDCHFTDGTLGELNNPWGDGAITVIDDPTGSGRGKICQIAYTNVSPGDSRERGLGTDEGTTPVLEHGDHLWYRCDMHLPLPSAPVFNRKLIDFQSGSGPTNRMTIHAVNQVVKISFVKSLTNGQSLGGHEYLDATITGYTMPWDTWITWEIFIKMNSNISTSDGVLKIYINGEMIYSKTDCMWLDQVTSHMQSFLTGYQLTVNSGYGSNVSENRYYDRVAFSTKRIGP